MILLVITKGSLVLSASRVKSIHNKLVKSNNRPNTSHNTGDLNYSKLEILDGSHPWRKIVPQGFVEYRVRELNSGQIAYFNFSLAKEMGLIHSEHKNLMTVELEKKLIQTFSIQIINEYDELKNKKFAETNIKTNKFMATRYLQLQHDNKKGTTSGDGRGIWNGCIEHKGQIWDVSSRGTGVTCLAPGAVSANKPLKTGGTEFGYGCGQAEIDELLSCAISAEIMHLQGYNTERVLCVIDLGKGVGIGVRASQNLFRPAHLFLYLKQNRLDELKSAFDYLCERQVKNKKWPQPLHKTQKYQFFLQMISADFAKFAAQLEVDYVFAWLDWDGDNVLFDAGIIDYGSIRQFGLRHDQYRYDDVQRYSTNLNEQKKKAAQLVQVFAQLVDAIITNEKKPIHTFKEHSSVKLFEDKFKIEVQNRFLYRIGFNQSQRDLLIRKNPKLVQQFQSIYNYFECAKVSGKLRKVADGVNRPPLFNMRLFLSEAYSWFYKDNNVDLSKIFNSILSSYGKKNKLKAKDKHFHNLILLRSSYMKLIEFVSLNSSNWNHLKFIERSQQLNSDQRITGNALIELVDELLIMKKRKQNLAEVQNVIDKIIYNYKNYPEVEVSKHLKKSVEPKADAKFFKRILQIVESKKEEI